MTILTRPASAGLFFFVLAVRGQVAVEYVAHACFIVESPKGVRVAIDPYNGYRWLGYSFPDNQRASAVLVSHPHYDHDASYYFGDAPVFRAAGEYSVGDVRIRGIAGRHAEPYGEEFGRTNILWLIETGGLRIAHLGDTGPLSADSIAALGRVDVLMLPVDGLEHILKFPEIEAIRRALTPKITIPMHYRLDGLTELPKDVGTIESWVAGRREARQVVKNRAVISLPATPEIWVFPHSPEVRPWSDRMKSARAAWDAARQLPPAEGLAGFRRAVELAPEVSVFCHAFAKALAETGARGEAIAVLERALARGGPKDWEYTRHMRALLEKLR